MTGHARLLFAAVVLMALPAPALAQTQTGRIDADSFQSALARVEFEAAEPTAAPVPTTLSRKQRTWIGFGVGALAGCFIGEYWLGQGLDFPHGPDMLIGAGVFGTVGALLARHSGIKSPSPASPKRAITIAPVLSKSTKAAVVHVTLK